VRTTPTRPHQPNPYRALRNVSIITKMTALAPASPRRGLPRDAPRVLCVDDEPNVLEGLRDSLRRSFDVQIAQSGAHGLALLQQDPDGYAVVISDMRMPVMSGAAFLNQARRIAPSAVRLLLTGHSDVDAAIRAVNDGQIFRFLTKPCPPDDLLRACAAALGQHRLLNAERVLLEQTLRGAIKALTDVLALTNPAAFGRGTRLKTGVGLLAQQIGMTDAWEVEIAALLLQLGAVTLPDATAEKLYSGAALTSEEQKMAAGVPRATERIIGHIPRMEGVLQVLKDVARRFDADDDRGPSLGGRMLRIVRDHDELESRGAARSAALDTMTTRSGTYDPQLLTDYARALGLTREVEDAIDVQVDSLRVGMTFAEDVRHRGGTLLIARGYKVTVALLARLEHIPRGQVREPLRVIAGSSSGEPVNRPAAA
jgi:FixJ family two-component response regulator